MPAYDFECPCGHTEERNVPIAQADEQHCPNCGQRLRKLISCRAIQIPAGWGDSTKADFMPRTAEERKTWDECGVAPRSSAPTSVSSHALEQAAKAVGG